MKRIGYRIFLAVFYFLASIKATVAQVKIIKVAPENTELGITRVHSPHIALYNEKLRSKHELLLMIQGTAGSASSLQSFDSTIAQLGYHVISIDYRNNVITTVCTKSLDSTCFNNFRQEIMFGTQVSDKVEVDSLNSLYNRFCKALLYLAKNDKGGGWEEFIKNGKPNWAKIIAGGHSQGAGHAAYLGKQFGLKGVMLFSGPQDFLAELNQPSAWEKKEGKTLSGNYYAFLHVEDPFNYHYQLQNVTAIVGQNNAGTIMVQPGLKPMTSKHVLVTNVKTKNPHGSVLDETFKEVWTYMIESLDKKK